VLGGGAAGAAAAKLLSEWGHSVRLITRPGANSRLAVSIPPSCRKLFEATGVDTVVDRAGLVRATGNTVWWGESEPRVEVFADGALGWQVGIQTLDDLLLSAAVAAGAEIDRRVITDADLRPADGCFVVDATGRSGLIARARGVRVHDEGPRTVALAASWRRPGGWPVPDDTHTLIESYESGWAWSVPTASNTRHMAVMVDPQRSGLVREAPAREVYLAEIAKTVAFKSLVATAECIEGPWGWDASTYRASQYSGDNWLLAGDAGSFIDPLSSAGVKKALASGWLAAIAVHTSLADSRMRAHALAFFSQREHEIERRYAHMSQSFLAEAAPTYPHAFWNDRSDLPDAPVDADSIAVRDAFERIRSAPALRLRRGDARIESRPSIRGRKIVLEPMIVTGDESIRYVSGIDVVSLRDLGPQFAQVPDLFEAYCRAHGAVALPDFLLALATSVARRWLVSQ
jgi:flavin-dependent dehydrogenase